MYARIAGLLMLVVGCGGAGLVIASGYSSRARELMEAKTAMALLETEICCSLRPLKCALENVATSGRGPVREMLLGAASGLADGATAAEAWARGIEAVMARSALSLTDAEVLMGLGCALGSSSAEDQRRHLREIAERLAGQERDARERLSREAKLWAYAGLLGGLAVAAVLL